MDAPLILFYVTIPHTETGVEIAKHLLQKKWIACANIFPAHTAVFQWEGEVKQESEHLLIIKTRQELAEKVETEISKLHPYECPCILQLTPSNANKPFWEWILQQTGEQIK